MPTQDTTIEDGSYEHKEYDTALQLCLKAYNSLMETQTPTIVVSDEDDVNVTTPEVNNATVSQGSNSTDWHHFKSFQTWHKAAASCGYIADGFMSLQVSSKSSTSFSSTSNTLALEDPALSLSASSSSGEESTSIEEESDDEESDVDPEELAQRCHRRSRRQSIILPSGGLCSQVINTPLPAVARQLPGPSSPTEEADPESFWRRGSQAWMWETVVTPFESTSEPFTFSMILTPPTDEGEYTPSNNWTPLQASERLVVPGCVAFGSTENRHFRCVACSDWAQDHYDYWSEMTHGAVARVMVTKSIEEQFSYHLHGKLNGPEIGFCSCVEWRRYERLNPTVDVNTLDDLPVYYEEAHTECEGEAEEEEQSQPRLAIPASTLAPPLSPVEAPMSPRWSEYGDDDEELPDLTDWT